MTEHAPRSEATGNSSWLGVLGILITVLGSLGAAYITAHAVGSEAGKDAGRVAGQTAAKSTEFHAALAADSVPVGTIVSSLFDPQTFAEAAGNDVFPFDPAKSKWCPADGRPIEGSRYSVLRNAPVPDFRGLFLRGLNTFDPNKPARSDANKDPDGDKRVAGDVQSDEFKRHNHLNEKDAGFVLHHPAAVPRGNMDSNLANPHPTEWDTSGPDFEGGAETRPRNIAIYYYIRIN